MEKGLYTPKEVYTMYDLGEKTLRDYADLIGEKVPGFSYHGGKRLYSIKEVEVIGYITRSKDKKMNLLSTSDNVVEIFYSDSIAAGIIHDLRTIISKAEGITNSLVE